MDLDPLVVIARFLLVAVFLAAGVTKLLDRDGAREAMRGFGLPEVLVPASALLLPLAELAIAVLLIWPSTAAFGAVAASALLVVFVAGIVANLVRGRRPDCHCFGRLHSTPIGWGHIARNGALVALSGIVFLGGGGDAPDAVAWVQGLTGGEQVLLVAVVALAIALALMVRVTHRLSGRLARLERGDEEPTVAVAENARPGGLEIGAPAPGFELSALGGGTTTLDDLLSDGLPVMLTFTDPSCGPCNELMPDIARWQTQHRRTLKIALISRGREEANASKAAKHGLTNVLLQDDDEVASAFGYLGTPGAIVIAADGTIAGELASGAKSIRMLLRRTVGADRSRVGIEAKNETDRVPDLRLPSLDGTISSLRDLREEVVLLFWNPSCGFCRKMLPDLKRFEAEGIGTRVVLVSTGSREDNIALGLSSTVLLDGGAEVGGRLGARGTPMAVRIDPEGSVISDVAVGAAAVLDLAREEPISPPSSGMSRRRLLNRGGVAAAAAVAYVTTGWSAALAACRKGLTRCGGKCVNLRTNENHCGKCRRKCLSSQHCSKGKCCARGKTNCGGKCVNLKTSEQHCGRCGHDCPSGKLCSKGKCCPEGKTNCGGTCVDRKTDPSNCGTCGNQCAAGETCVSGECQTEPSCEADVDCDDGNPCTSDTCESGTCMHNFVPAGTICGENMVCDGAGTCAQEVQCESAGDCDDGNPCTADICEAGTCMHEAIPAGTICGENMVCDGAGTCQPDGCAGEGEPCNAGLGACYSEGVIACDQNGDPYCTAEPGTPTAEVCNGIDDDCDGTVDNGAICPSGANAIWACVGGACEYTCDFGFADCDVETMGCETEIMSNNQHCGACFNACVGDEVCVQGVCTQT